MIANVDAAINFELDPAKVGEEGRQGNIFLKVRASD